MLRWVGFLAAALVTGGGSAASADDGELPETLVERARGCSVTVCVPGRYEFHYIRNGDYALDADGNQHGVLDLGVQRWRVRPRVTFLPKLFLELEADLLTGQLFGDQPHHGVEFVEQADAFDVPDPADLRQLYISWQSPIGLLRIGHQTSQYGYGLIANGGDNEAADVFDRPSHGDIVERVLFATRPLQPFVDGPAGEAFIVAGGFDVVFRDDNASLVDGDLAMQGVVSLMWRTDELTAGVYMAFRTQEDDDGDTLEAQAYDLFVEWRHDFESLHARLTVGVEAALIVAETTRAALEQAPTGVDVMGFGGVLRSELTFEEYGLGARLEVGYASGDNNRNDDLVRSFSFDPGYHVGMILFQEVMSRISANTVDRIRDPAISGSPPKGVELVATEGSVTNAIYLNPILRWKSTFGLGIDFGVLAAWAAADVIDPWVSAQNGGYNFNHLGKAMDSDSRYLGTEIDGGLHYTIGVREAVDFLIGVRAGLLVPGGVFDAPDGGSALGNVFKVRTSFQVAW